VISVQIPPLRERKDDLLALADSFLAFYSAQLKREPVRFSEEARKRLVAYPWPGNIRELRNTVERAVILSHDQVIDQQFIPVAASADGGEDPVVGANVTLDALEEAHIRKILRKTSSLDAAAKTLGIDPATLYRKRKRLNL
jgi:NtrC-family two-component system response regulator AlgB